MIVIVIMVDMGGGGVGCMDATAEDKSNEVAVITHHFKRPRGELFGAKWGVLELMGVDGKAAQDEQLQDGRRTQVVRERRQNRRARSGGPSGWRLRKKLRRIVDSGRQWETGGDIGSLLLGVLRASNHEQETL